MKSSESMNSSSKSFLNDSIEARYSYNFEWMGCPIIQYQQDIFAVQELIWDVNPDFITETGVAHGGSAVFVASLLELNALSGRPKDAVVWCIEFNLCAYNREAILANPMFPRLRIFDGSNLDKKIGLKVSYNASLCQRAEQANEPRRR